MSALSKVLTEEIRKIEDTRLVEDSISKYRLTHHLMPPVGWLNDPNGLCWFKGRYHVFFQYAPFEVEGGLKCWGHYSSEDLVNWRYEGAPLLPDSPQDCHGVYSGSALVENDKLHLFYTGNVKLDGDYDYINNGRETSTLHVESEDGIHFSNKEVVIPFSKYPEEYTCHIRDPKVWKDGEVYRMVLGGRKKDDTGAVLFYQSKDFKDWSFEKEITTETPFGYMWECPDYFQLGGKGILSVSPQGVQREEYRYQNIYQSGYFLMENNDKYLDSRDFREWDMGFDFYAPQTFTDGKGRRILIGWMGMPDAEEEYINLTVKEGWQHCLTLPRELTMNDGKIYQYPVEELSSLRKGCCEIDRRKSQIDLRGPFDLELKIEGETAEIHLGRDLSLSYRNGCAVLTLSEDAGAGRRTRKARLDQLKEVRIVSDISAVEIYLNRGETVFSTRYYPGEDRRLLRVEAEDFRGKVFSLDSMTFGYCSLRAR
ncbi:MAG: glycoside hydrolase family 32 protein [Eubacteriales bacterium]|nr:glycoside hydrolase family 32 protein [Eubacteriales bacterium]